MQRAVRQTHTDATVGARYAAQTMDTLHHATSQVRAISNSLMAACDMALMLATALAVLDKATHTITHEDEPEYSLNPDTLPILPADTVGVYTFLQNIYQEREQSPLPLIAIPSGATSDLRGSSADGVRYLLQQNTCAGSAYHMPNPDAPQQNWEDWFDKLSSMPNHYDIATEAIIHTVTGHLHSSNPVLHGWTEQLSSLKENNSSITLHDFFSHVRKQLFVNRDTRQCAYEELVRLPHHLNDFADCAALITKLKQLWPRIYPKVTDERQPSPPYEVCLDIHRMMMTIQHSSYSQCKDNVLRAAWREYQFPAPDMFTTFLREGDHQDPLKSQETGNDYLRALYDHLRDAQEMWVKVHKPTIKSHKEFAGPLKRLAAYPIDARKHKSMRWVANMVTKKGLWGETTIMSRNVPVGEPLVIMYGKYTK
jgi:hypothetical protein